MMAQPIFMKNGHTKKIFTSHEQLQKMHTSVRYNRRIRKKLSEKTDEVVGKDSIGYRRS